MWLFFEKICRENSSFIEIWQKSVEKIQVSLKSDKNLSRNFKFHWNLTKICRENSTFIEIWQEKRVLCIQTYVHFLSHVAHFFLEWEIFQPEVVEKIKAHILCSTTFFWKTCRLWDNVEKMFIVPDRPQTTIKHGTHSWHAGYLRPQKHIQNIWHLELYHSNNGWNECASILHYTTIRSILTSLMV